MLPLAQTLPPAADLYAFTGCVVFCLAVAVAVKKLFFEKAAPQPFVVKPHEDAVTKNQLTEVHGRISRERKELDLALARIEAAHAAATQRLDGELRGIRDEIKESRDAGEVRMEKLRASLDDQTRLIIEVIREAKS